MKVESSLTEPSVMRAQLEAQRQAFKNESIVSFETRIDRLDRCINLIVENQQAIYAAVDQDFGGRCKSLTAMMDLYTSVSTLKNVKKHLKKWMRVEKRKSPFPMNILGARSEIHYQPKGVVGIMSPWNIPVNALFSPLADIFGAGNRAMLKPSESNPATAELMQSLFARYFSSDEVTVICGGVAESVAFSELPFDHIIFTGAGSIGKHVLQAAAKNLVPVTLELGGKSPAVVSKKAKLQDAAEKIITGKALNSGQVCLSPDYCFVPTDKLDKFVEICKETIAEQYPTVMDNPDYVSIINERHYDRLMSFLDDARGKGATIISLAPEGERWDERSKHRIPIQLIINPSDDMLVMQEELFGPILCIKSYDQLDNCIAEINSREHPLALYYFGQDKAEQARLIAETTSGGMSINDIAVHFACDDLPFGGIGPSGMGHYHGHEGFKTFSHAKSVFKQGRVNLAKLAGTLPPYGERIAKMIPSMVKK